MPLVCTHCSRVNSPDARYCYFDGVALLGSGPALAAKKTFLVPFVFASGLTCNDLEAFATGCQHNWDAAVEMLHKGFFQQFFNSLGRLDLAQIAQEGANFPDRDRGLDQFLSRLPTKSGTPAKLDVQPKLVNFGTLKVGQDAQLELTLENRGGRLIFGSISTDCNWLAVTETGDAKLFQFRDQTKITIQVKGQNLRAGVKPLEGDLFIESNAGTFKLKAVATVPIQPFAGGCLAGAKTPRELAEKAKKSPKEAGVLFENGSVPKWYEANGWTYPVQGPASNGMAAVQQFFEALGLSKPPKVYITDALLHLKGAPGAKITRQVQVRSDENRPVFAHAVSNVSWCVVKQSLAQGNAVTIPLEITVPDQAGAALVSVTSNGKQRFDIPVRVAVEEATKAAATIAAPSATTGVAAAKPTQTSDASLDFTSPTTPATPRPPAAPFDPVKLALHLVPLVFLVFFMLGLVVTDMLTSAPAPQRVAISDDPVEDKRGSVVKEAKYEAKIQDEPDEGPVNAPGVRFTIEDEPEERFGKQPMAPVKVEIKDEPEEVAPMLPKAGGVPVDPILRVSYRNGGYQWGLTDTATNKRLTFSEVGSTNRTILRIAGQSRGFGGFNKIENLPDDPAREARKRSSYSFSPQPGFKVTQILEIVPSKQPVDVGGKQRRRMDTLLVRYLFVNTANQPINAGLRLEVDTLIGSNDGVPFTVPGKGFVNTSADFLTAKDVPDFVQALETGNLTRPGTIVHISLKVGGAVEAPSRVTLCHWASNGDLSTIRPTNMGTDSAIIMVWPDENLAPGKTREMGYAYGLGSVTVADPGGSMAVSLDGDYDIGKSFTILAYVNKPVNGQTVTLELPPGLDRIKGEATQKVPPPNVGATSIVSWEARVQKTGVFPVKVRSSTGLTQTKTITIAQGEAPTGGKLSLDLKGAFEPGQVFTVIGKVSEPLANQTLTLYLPAGLEKTAGDMTQPVPAPPPGSKDAQVQWQVRVKDAGKYPVRVASSTGVAQTKTITIVQPGRAEGAFQILLTGDFAPGKTFNVSTKVATPAPNQQLTLILPDGLQRVAGNDTQTALADVPLTWKVKVEKIGKFTVGVKSTTGVTQRKTVLIEPPADVGGRFDFALVGDISPGKDFKVNAEVTSPVAGQTLTLVLPKELRLASGDATRTVPPAAKGAVSSVSWTVRVSQTGRLPVRIESSTGLVRTKTITLADTSSTLFGR